MPLQTLPVQYATCQHTSVVVPGFSFRPRHCLPYRFPYGDTEIWPSVLSVLFLMLRTLPHFLLPCPTSDWPRVSVAIRHVLPASKLQAKFATCRDIWCPSTPLYVSPTYRSSQFRELHTGPRDECVSGRITRVQCGVTGQASECGLTGRWMNACRLWNPRLTLQKRNTTLPKSCDPNVTLTCWPHPDHSCLPVMQSR